MENPNQITLNKNHFPKLIKSLTEQIQLKESKNIRNGFRAAGISPLNSREVLKRLPEYHADLASYEIDHALLDYLKHVRQPKPMNLKRNKKVITEPGKSLTISDFTHKQRIASGPLESAVTGRVKPSKNNRISTKGTQQNSTSYQIADMSKDYISEGNIFLNEKNGLIETIESREFTHIIEIQDTKQETVIITGNPNNEPTIKVLSSVSITAPKPTPTDDFYLTSTSTGKVYQSASFFRPKIQIYDSNTDIDFKYVSENMEIDNEEKNNMLEEIGIKKNMNVGK